ncbi:hypothetical protein NQ152_12915 [Microbacterium sp. zg.B48]|nr:MULTISPECIES: hypothetical protein [unclassified Microbacterium]MCR2764406.1 hypothetical protein [Microbacterium sp. zg.B48]MCR2810991.1 hypothetical protein [Microbacterium sp. zg.B185]WIM19611.1 hypothetical protein QNO12_02045 [Microbacterium sp. zg-B185]
MNSEKVRVDIDDDLRADVYVLDEDLRDDADAFEDALLAEMRQRGAIEVW